MSIIDWARANAESNRRKKHAKYLAHKRPAPGKCLSGEQIDQIAAEARWQLEEGKSTQEAKDAALERFEEWLWRGGASAKGEALAGIESHFEMIKSWSQYKKYFK